MRLWTAALLVLFFSVLPLSGCSGPQSVSEKQKVSDFAQPQYDWGKSTGETLVIWTQEKELDRVYMQRAFKRYQEATGNELKIVELPKAQFEEKTAAAFRGNGEKPDVLLSYGGTNIENYNPDENFYDFTKAVWVSDLTNTSINQTIYNGKVIGLPHWEASISGILYNKPMFKKYGISIPKTQAEFLAACEKLHKNGVIPMYLPGAEISMLLYQFPLDVIIQDSDKLNALNSGQLHYADMPEMETIIEWYRTMAKKGYFGENYRTDNWNGMNEAMRSEKYAMMLCWDTWLYTDFNGDRSKFGLMPAFVGIPETGTFEGPNLALLIVNKKSARLQAALDFITFMADPYNYNAAFENIYTAPVFKNQVASISTPQYSEVERLIERNYHDSKAWLRIRGFSQMDAACILKFMDGTDNYTAQQCLREMDALREKRVQ